MLFCICFVFPFSLKVGVTDEVLQEEGKKACSLSRHTLTLEEFAEYVSLPVTETLQDVFALFEEVGNINLI